MNTRLVAGTLAAMLILVACGGPSATSTPSGGTTSTPGASATAVPSATDGTSPGTEPSASTEPSEPTGSIPSISGNVDVHGSSTVAPISNAVAEDLADPAINPDFSYFVGDEGTGAGFEEFFCVDNGDIADASRPIRASDPSNDEDEEADICAANGIAYVELKVAYDGIAVITHPDNPIECLTFADLYALMGPEADAVANWNDAEALAHELGSTTDLPDAALFITAPGDESGTYDSFVELALGDLIEEREQAESLRSPSEIYVASPNDNAIIQGIGGTANALGFVGLSYAAESADQVKILGVDGGDGCVSPSIDTVSNGTYPISRPLFIYPNLGRATENAAIGAYIDYYLSDAGIANAAEVGYVPLPAEELQATRDAWEAAKP